MAWTSTTTRARNGFNAVLPIPLDSVQEFRTTVAGLGADLGRSARRTGLHCHQGRLQPVSRLRLRVQPQHPHRSQQLVQQPRRRRRVRHWSATSTALRSAGRSSRIASSSSTTTKPAKTAAPVQDCQCSHQQLRRRAIVQVLLKDGRTVHSVSAGRRQHRSPAHRREPLHAQPDEAVSRGKQSAGGTDKGLNFNQLLFNAPNTLDNHAQVARMDYNIDPAGKHSIMVRGTLNGARTATPTRLAQFPGQSAASRDAGQLPRFGGPLHRRDLSSSGQRAQLRLHPSRHRRHRQSDRYSHLRFHHA